MYIQLISYAKVDMILDKNIWALNVDYEMNILNKFHQIGLQAWVKSTRSQSITSLNNSQT